MGATLQLSYRESPDRIEPRHRPNFAGKNRLRTDCRAKAHFNSITSRASTKGTIFPLTPVGVLPHIKQNQLILFAPHAFASQSQEGPSALPSPLVFPTISTDFTPTP